MHTWKTTASVAPKNRVGTISLIIAAAGFFGFEMSHMLGGYDGPVWTLARGGFEAAVVGGLADWFAVRALFRAIPSKPLPALPHTNVIVVNRANLTNGLVDFLERQLLSPTTLQEELGSFSASRLLLANLESVSGQSSGINACLSVADRLAGEIQDDDALRAAVADVIRQQIREADLAPIVGAWLLQRVQAGDTKSIWMQVAARLADEAEAESFDSALADILTAAVATVRAESMWRGMAFHWFVDPKKDARHLRTALVNTLRDQAKDANHARNERLDVAVAQFAHRLSSGDPEAVAVVTKLQKNLAASVDVESLVTYLAADLRAALQTSMNAPVSECRQRVTKVLLRVVERLKADEAAQENIDAWVRGRLQDLASRYHRVIGATARKSIDRLADEALVAELESRVGQDLQFIRLNGAVIGGSVGVAIAAARMIGA